MKQFIRGQHLYKNNNAIRSLMGETEKRGGFYGLIKMFGMDSKSLMIGDWVLWNGSDGNVYPFQIVTLGAFEDLPCKALPLTEEILKANGFRNEDNVWLSVDDSFGIDNQEGLMEFFKYRMFEDDSVLEAQIPYCYNVHELQRALRCCKMNKLADNFIIK